MHKIRRTRKIRIEHKTESSTGNVRNYIYKNYRRYEGEPKIPTVKKHQIQNEPKSISEFQHTELKSTDIGKIYTVKSVSNFNN